ncbi:NADH-quinone oxidoreductase subunit L [Nitriliruptoraceae bacterium ZYF776]|nr:NADH-quinone oxidoreductase subunit L [Profundirhabdus halotolerans]
MGVAWLIPLVPLLGFLVVLLVTKRLRERAAYVAIGAAAVAFLVSIAVFLQVQGDPATHVRPLATWIDVGHLTVTFDLLIDQLTAVMLLVVTGVGLLVHVYSLGYMHGDARFERFFAYLNLFLFSMLVLVLGSNLLTLFLGWELVGLSSYLLIGFWFEKREYASAAKKAFITNRVGDVSFMVAMFLAFATFGTLTFTEFLPEAGTLSTGVATALVLLLLGGAVAKSAQIPLYVWLPDAMAGPTPVSALIHAATMVTAGIYLLVRTSPILVQSIDAMQVIGWIGALTALMAALIAIRQDDIKKILAYSTVSQLGYMFLAVGVGAFREGIFHLVTHAFFKGLLFLAAGSVMHAMLNRTDAWQMGGLRKAMPITFWTSMAGWLAISGVFPFAGFFSKDQILTEAYLHGYLPLYLIGLVTAALTAFYMSRWFFLIFLGEPRYGREVHPHESPSTMTVPLVVLAVLSVIGGVALNPVHAGPLYEWLGPVVAPIGDLGYEAAGPLTEIHLIAISLVAAGLGIGAAYLAYVRRDVSQGRTVEPIRGVVAELFERKFFVDELYEAIFVRAGGRLAAGLTWVDTRVIDGAVNGAGAVSTAIGRTARRTQTGLVRGYVAGLLVGAVALVVAVLIQVG